MRRDGRRGVATGKMADLISENRSWFERVLGLDVLKQDVEELKKGLAELTAKHSGHVAGQGDGRELDELLSKNAELEKKKSELEGDAIRFQRKIESLSARLEEKSQAVSNLREQFRRREGELCKQIGMLEQERDRLEGRSERLELELDSALKKISVLEDTPARRVKRLYDTLDESSREGLANIFPSGEEAALFAGGIIRMEALWKYAAYLRQQHIDGEFEKVRDIFYILFEEYARVMNASFQDVRQGEQFMLNSFIRDNRSSAQNGIVASVVLKGFLVNGQLVQKSIVKVKQ